MYTLGAWLATRTHTHTHSLSYENKRKDWLARKAGWLARKDWLAGSKKGAHRSGNLILGKKRSKDLKWTRESNSVCVAACVSGWLDFVKKGATRSHDRVVDGASANANQVNSKHLSVSHQLTLSRMKKRGPLLVWLYCVCILQVLGQWICRWMC